MKKEAIQHFSDSTYAYALNQSTLKLKLRTAKNDLQKAVLHFGYRYQPTKDVTMSALTMSVTYSDELFDYYEAVITPGYTKVCYYFELVDGNEQVFYAQERFSHQPPDSRNEYFLFPYINKGDLYSCDNWLQDAIVYQIFVDRFNKENIDENWYKEPWHYDIFGGNLQGIIQKLDYLSDLGINCIYLTPIFESNSNHKYDTLDYYKIAKDFGNEQDFKELVDACHARNIRVILDAVYNHSSDKFFAFQDYLKNGQNSKYKDWYVIDEQGQYESFAGVKNMPKLNTTNPEVVNYLLDISRHWIKHYNIDAWRLDVANEIDHDFWRKFRAAVKGEKKEAAIIGEVWDGGESFMQGDQFDSTMNYPFMQMALDYFAKKEISVERFDSLINNLFVRYKTPMRQQLMNLLDSHDTSRFLFECAENVEALKMAVFFMLTCIGIPMVFYGDEVGLSADNDPYCRMGMRFGDFDQDLHIFYKKMIQIRKEYIALRRGEFQTMYAAHDVYAYCRYTDQEKVFAIFNNSSEKHEITLTIQAKQVRDILTEQVYEVNNDRLTLNTEPLKKYILIPLESSM